MNIFDILRMIYIKWNEKKGFGVDDINILDVLDFFVSFSSINSLLCVIYMYI